MKMIHVLSLAVALAASAPSIAHADVPPANSAFQDDVNAARLAALDDLSDENRAKVQVVIARALNGALVIDEAARQIDDLLSPTETQLVSNEEEKIRRLSPQSFANLANQQTPYRHVARYESVAGSYQMDIGRFLLMVSGVNAR